MPVELGTSAKDRCGPADNVGRDWRGCETSGSCPIRIFHFWLINNGQHHILRIVHRNDGDEGVEFLSFE